MCNSSTAAARVMWSLFLIPNIFAQAIVSIGLNLFPPRFIMCLDNSGILSTSLLIWSIIKLFVFRKSPWIKSTNSFIDRSALLIFFIVLTLIKS